MAYRPALRADLIREGEPELTSLFDPLLGRRVGLGVLGRSMVPLLTGRRTVAEVIDALEQLHPTRTLVEIETTLRSMLLLHCLEGTGTELFQRVAAIRQEGRPPALECLEETRVRCEGSGSCCQMFSIGPLTDRDVATIEALDIAGKLPEAGPGPHIQKLPGVQGRYLKSVNDRCVFLQQDRRCGLHAVFGVEAKPLACRLFPLSSRPTLFGIRIFDLGECASLVSSAREGRPVRDELEALEPLTRTTTFEHPIVFLDERTPCDFSYVLALSDALVGQVGRAADVATGLEAAAGLIDRWVEAMRSCPLEPGAAERAAAIEFEQVAEAPPAKAEGFTALADLAHSFILNGAENAYARAAIAPERLTTRIAGSFLEAAALVRAGAAHLADPAGAPLPAVAAAIFAVRVDEAWVDDALRRSLRQRIHGNLLIGEARFRAGFAAAALVVLLAVTAARARAHAQGRDRIVPEDLSFGHSAVSVGLREPKALAAFLPHDAVGTSIARAAARLLR